MKRNSIMDGTGLQELVINLQDKIDTKIQPNQELSKELKKYVLTKQPTQIDGEIKQMTPHTYLKYAYTHARDINQHEFSDNYYTIRKSIENMYK